MKSVLIAIQPYWVFLIIAKIMGWEINQEKTVEVRKTFPEDLDWNKKAIIYCSKNKQSFNRIPKKYQSLMEKFLGNVIGEFVCDSLIWVLAHPSIFAGHPVFYSQAIKDACLTQDEVEKYSGGKDVYGWHISNLVIYEKPKELSEFKKAGFMTEEQWLYNLYPHTHCHYEAWAKKFDIASPPQSWCYVNELGV